MLGQASRQTLIRVGLAIGVIVVLGVGPIDNGVADARQTDPTAAGFRVAGAHDLGARGLNAGLALAGDCAYVGSRGEGPILILDIGDLAAPNITGEIRPVSGSSAREVRTDTLLGILTVLTFRLDPFSAAPNRLDIYNVSTCTQPILVGQIDFGEAPPHEVVLWRDPDPARASRLLAFVSMWGYAPNLRVFDLTDPSLPLALTEWDASTGTGAISMLHSVSLSEDGSRAYMADWLLGIMILDTSAIARGEKNPEMMLLTPPAGWVVLPGGNHHSAVPIPGTG